MSGILASVEAKLTALADDPAIHRRRVRVRAIGCLTMLPAPVLAAITAAEHATAGYDGFELNIAVAYGGRQEISDAVRRVAGPPCRRADDIGRGDRPTSRPKRSPAISTPPGSPTPT